MVDLRLHGRVTAHGRPAREWTGRRAVGQQRADLPKRTVSEAEFSLQPEKGFLIQRPIKRFIPDESSVQIAGGELTG